MEQERQDEKVTGELSKKTILIVICLIVLATIGTIIFYGARKTTIVAPQPQRPATPLYTLTPSNITTAAGIAQVFTAEYPVSGGWQNLSDASLYIAGGGHDQWVHYYPVKNSFSFDKQKGSCKPGEATSISTKYLTLNCGASSVSGPGEKPKITFSLTPQPPFSKEKYVLLVVTFDNNKASSGKLLGNWTVK